VSQFLFQFKKKTLRFDQKLSILAEVIDLIENKLPTSNENGQLRLLLIWKLVHLILTYYSLTFLFTLNWFILVALNFYETIVFILYSLLPVLNCCSKCMIEACLSDIRSGNLIPFLWLSWLLISIFKFIGLISD